MFYEGYNFLFVDRTRQTKILLKVWRLDLAYDEISMKYVRIKPWILGKCVLDVYASFSSFLHFANAIFIKS